MLKVLKYYFYQFLLTLSDHLAIIMFAIKFMRVFLRFWDIVPVLNVDVDGGEGGE